MEQFVQIESLILELLLIVAVVSTVVRRLRIPYTVALVLAGLALSIHSTIQIDLTPDLILYFLIPPLVFEAAYHLKYDQLMKDMRMIVLLAVPGVIINLLIVGGIIAWGAGLSINAALLFGALIAATDPVSVVAIFRKLGAPKRLELMLESESLFNDGTAIVLFNLALTASLTGRFDLVNGVVDFVRVAAGGIIIGLVLGWLVSALMSRINDYLIATTLTTVLAFGSYLLAEQVHVSGVLAVVMAGLINGNIGERGVSASTRIVILNFWEYVAFLANSAVFLLIGLQIDIAAMASTWQMIVWAIGAVLAGRAIVIYLFSRLGGDLPRGWRHILFWGGLRGAIALALALSLPSSLGPEREVMIEMAFGVVLFSLIGQGLTIEPLIRRLKLIIRSEDRIEYERRRARALAHRAGIERLQGMYEEGLLSSHTWESIAPVLQSRLEALTLAVRETLVQKPELEVDEMIAAHQEALRTQRLLLTDLRQDGVITDETYEELVTDIDISIDSDADTWVHNILGRGAQRLIKQLILAVVQPRDLESATSALTMRGFPSTLIQSSGGFLKRRNNILLVGIPKGRLSDAVDGLRSACSGRVEYLSAPSVPDSIPIGAAVPIEVQGATVFIFDIERYEELHS